MIMAGEMTANDSRVLRFIRDLRLFEPVERNQIASIARVTPVAMLGHSINTAIAVAALWKSTPHALLLGWGVLSYAIAGFIFLRSIRRRPVGGAKDTEPGRKTSLNGMAVALAFAVLLALPWASLAVFKIGRSHTPDEVIVIALAVGMAASGSVLLAPIMGAAAAYMLTILVPTALNCLVNSGGATSLAMGALALSYAAFLASLIWTTNKMFFDKMEALRSLRHSVAKIGAARRDLEHLAGHDPLTGLLNRRGFLDALRRTHESGDHDSYALLYLDLDRFKMVNDTLGHHSGDLLLKAVAERLEKMVRASDVVARLGGDEFAILALDLRDGSHAQSLARRIVESVSEPFVLIDNTVLVGVSIGIARANPGLEGFDEILKKADLAMYSAKSSGRNTFRYYEPQLLALANAKREIELGLRQAIAQSQFALFYQPIVNLASGQIVGLEALLRWHHPERGLISPNDFLQVAEETGLIRDIGTWVLHEACKHASLWPESLFVAVNMSPHQLSDDSVIETVDLALKNSGLSPERLELEITETALMGDLEKIKWRLRQIKERGISIAMDDFGTGYSSLSYLASFPFDKIKIDRSFVGRLHSGQDGNAIVSAVIQLATSLKCSTVAEGIETPEQVEALAVLGAPYGQGYYYSKPLSHDSVAPYLVQHLQSIDTVERANLAA